LERKLASIQVVEKIVPIEGATSIELAQILGWSVIVKKSEFAPGDSIIYCEPDSVLPELPPYEFLRKGCFVNNGAVRGHRIRTLKLSKFGVISQGIVFPLTLLPDSHYTIGEDVTQILGIVKFDKPVPVQLKGKVRGTRPSFVPRTDEMRIQAVPNVLTRNKGKVFQISEKCDGTNANYFMDPETGLHACSREMDLHPGEPHKFCGNSYWKYALDHNMDEVLYQFGNVALQGELLGPGIQSNKYNLSELVYRVFNVYDIQNKKYMELDQILDAVDTFGLGKDFTVPYLEQVTLDHSVEELLTMADGRSKLNGDTWREGIVLRSVPEQLDQELGRLSFKCISRRFQLAYGE